MRVRIPRRPRRRRPTGTSQRLGLTRAQLQKLQKRRPTTATPARPTATPAKRKPTGTPRRAPIGTPIATPDPRIRRRPTGTPKPKQGVVTPRDLPRKPTSQQRAAMRRQAIARFGNAATRRRRQDAGARRAVRRGDATPGQIRSYKSMRQKAALYRPRRTTKRTSRRLV